MAYGSPKHNQVTEKEENMNMEETKEITRGGYGHELPTSRQSAGPRPATNVSCGCTGGGSWIFLVIVAGLVGLYVLASILR